MGLNQSGTQGILVSWFGGDKGTVRDGAQRLAGAAVCAIPVRLDAGDADPQVVGILTQGLSVLDVLIQSANSLGTAVTLTVDESAAGEGDGFDIVTGAATTAAGTATVTGDARAALEQDRTLRATVAGGTAGETVELAIIVVPKYEGWS